VLDIMNRKERAVYLTKSTGVLPAIKLKREADIAPYIQAMYDGGARVVEITMTTPNALDHFKVLSDRFAGRLCLAAGTVLDAPTARAAILAGVDIVVAPAMIIEVIQTAHRYGVACYIGAFSATECLAALQAGADMVKVFPAALGGPKYMTNLKMVYPEINLIPSGGISLENAGDFIRCGASAISGARNFFDYAMVEQHGLGWVRDQVDRYKRIVTEARESAPPLP
jgi:2-dehydro-3-deoxyphosphogluconate aldolase/(4S)-4-hydroxy-2-oxoglutarate aldolase